MNTYKKIFLVNLLLVVSFLVLAQAGNVIAKEENVGRYAIVEQTTGEVVNVILLDPSSNWAPPRRHIVIPAGNASPGEDIWDGQKFKKGAQKKPELSPVPVSADGNDIAELMFAADPSIEPGDLVAVSKQGPGIRKSSKPYDKDIIGIVSTDPGVILGKPQLANQQKVALAGVVPLKVSLENGPIAIGDPITSSSLLGVGMAACAKAPASQGKLCKDGQTIGIALTPYDGTQSTSKILVFVNLGYRKLNLDTEIASSGSLNFLNSSSETSFSLKLDEPKGLFAITSGSSSTPGFTMDLSGNVGIGTTTPSFKLDIQDMQIATAAAQIFNTSDSTDADGLIIKLGNTSTDAVASTNRFINFETSGLGIVGSISGNGAKGVTYATSGIADFAEYFKKDPNQNVEFGSVMCLNESGFAVLCNSLNSKILGIASERPAFLGGENLGDGSIAVGLVGQVETLVSNANGEIKAGDPLTSSDIAGVAVKATKPGQIVGKAVQGHNETGVKKILVSVNVSWYDPSIYITASGDLNTNSIDDGRLMVEDGSLKLDGGSSTQSSSLQPQDTTLDPLSSTVNELTNKFNLLQSKLDLLSLQFEQQSSVSGQVLGVASDSAAASSSASFIQSLGDVAINNATIMDNLMVLGRTTVTDLGVTGNINAGVLAIHGLTGEINTLSGDLYLQKDSLGGVDILNGKIVIDTLGNMTVAGEITVKKINIDESTTTDKSVGGAVIKAGETEVEVKTTALTSKSYVFVSSDKPTEIGAVIEDQETIKILIKNKSHEDIKVNWWIVN